MALNPVFGPLLEAVKYIFEAPGGVFMVRSITVENQGAETLTIAPPSSMKLFESAENKAELLNLGLIGNGYLKKKISPKSLAWLKEHGWADPQEPFNPHHSVSGRGDLSLDEMLEFALESWVIAYDVSPEAPLSLHTSLVDQEHIAANFLTLDRETFAFMIPGFKPNMVLEPAPPKRKRPPKKADSKKSNTKPAGAAKTANPAKPELKTPAPKKPANSGFAVGDTAHLKVVIQGQKKNIAGIILGIDGDKVRLQVKGSAYVKDQVFLVPSGKLTLE